MPTPRSLRSQLDAYEATSRDADTAGKTRRRGWSQYATAVGSGLALATAADADIIYSGIKDLSATASTGDGPATIKIDMDGHNFIGNVSRGWSWSIDGGASLKGGARSSVLRNGSGQLKNLASGAKISSGAGDFGTRGNLRRSAQTFYDARMNNGTWPQSQKGFAGVKFSQGGQEHFGWIQLEWTGSAWNGLGPVPKTLTAIDWAYQSDPDTPIEAGAGIPPAVPEPNSAMIAFLASGCVGVLALRQRRRQRVAEAQDATATGPE